MRKTDRIKMYLRWFLSILVVDGILRVISAVIFPFVIYPLRKCIRFVWNQDNCLKWIAFPFWIFLNDGQSNDIGYDWFWRAKGVFPTSWFNKWRLSCAWYRRNPCWNVYEFIKPKKGMRENLVILKGNGIDRILRWKLKDGTPNNNKGDLIDFDQVKFGESHIEYSIGGTNYFRYTKAWMKPVRFFFRSYLLHHELQVGWNNSRAKIRCKYILKRYGTDNAREWLDNYVNKYD